MVATIKADELVDSGVSAEDAGAVAAERYTGDNVRASWPFSLHTIRSNIAHCSPEGKDAMVTAFLWCTDSKHPVHKDEFSRRVGYSANVIYKILSGKYHHPESKAQLDVPADLIKAINNFLRLERDRVMGGKNEFVLTPTAKRIFLACDLARESQTPVFLSGVSQIGKTTALERYAAENNHGRTVYARMKAASGLGGMVRRVAERVGVSNKSCTANLIDYLKNAITQDMLLILDEMHLLQYTYRLSSFFGCLEVIREIQDETKCGMVLCGTQLLLTKMQAGQHKEMEQLMRRGVHKVTLPDMPTRGDLVAILNASGLEFPKAGDVVSVQGIQEKPYDVLRQLAKTSGLKSITERLRYGRKLAAKKHSELAWEHFIEAHLTVIQQAEADKGWN